ncbi:MAG: hypothetical protein H6623_08915 [Bdellovibrionaceae bacterium]|nr:hypothetical protein [Pseudobdellovibrionaceae bacterium]
MSRHYCTPLIITQTRPTDGKYQTRRVFCRRWSCKFCGPIKKYKLSKKMAEYQVLHALGYFFTLTLAPNTVQPKDSPIYIQNCWKKFSILFRRKYGAFKYVVVREFQKNGMAHIHGIVDKRCKLQWLSETWQAVGGGKIVDVQPCDERTVKYLIKYIAKDTPMKLPKRYRRVAASRGLVLFPRNPNAEWRVLNQHYEWLRNQSRTDSDIFEPIHQWGEEVGFASDLPLEVCNFHNDKQFSPQILRGAI